MGGPDGGQSQGVLSEVLTIVGPSVVAVMCTPLHKSPLIITFLTPALAAPLLTSFKMCFLL